MAPQPEAFITRASTAPSFALPSTSEPEGDTAEKAKGNVRSLAAGDTARFTVELGHLDAGECRREAERIAG